MLLELLVTLINIDLSFKFIRYQFKKYIYYAEI